MRRMRLKWGWLCSDTRFCHACGGPANLRPATPAWLRWPWVPADFWGAAGTGCRPSRSSTPPAKSSLPYLLERVHYFLHVLGVGRVGHNRLHDHRLRLHLTDVALVYHQLVTLLLQSCRWLFVRGRRVFCWFFEEQGGAEGVGNGGDDVFEVVGVEF